jgi:aquaporin Z
MKQNIIEFIGTFFLVLVITLSGNPIAVGAILIAMVYMGGYISGAHYNPAVTLAVWLRGKMERADAFRYMAFQTLGALSAAFINYLITGNAIVPKPSADITFISIILVEAIFTFALASVVLHATTSRKTVGNEYYALAIGLTVMAAAFAGGPISGAVINPAVAIGTMVVDLGNLTANFTNLVFYILGPALGAALAANVYNTVLKDPDDDRPRKG